MRSCCSATATSEAGSRRTWICAQSLRARVSEMDYVDLRFGNRVFVRPADGLAIGSNGRPGAGAARAPS